MGSGGCRRTGIDVDESLQLVIGGLLETGWLRIESSGSLVVSVNHSSGSPSVLHGLWFTDTTSCVEM